MTEIYQVVAKYLYDDDVEEFEEVDNHFWFETIDDARDFINTQDKLPYGKWNKDKTIKSFTREYFEKHKEIPYDANLGLGNDAVDTNVSMVSLEIVILTKWKGVN